MPKILIRFGLISALVIGASTPALSDPSGCSGQMHAQAACTSSGASSVQEFAAQKKRTRVTVYGRRTYLPPNAVRQCRSWLAREYRVSGPVIVPQMYCWWEY